MKLTYYLLPHQTDSSCYSIRKRTKKAVIQEIGKLLIEDKMSDSNHWRDSYSNINLMERSCGVEEYTISKIVIEYDNSFDLMDQLVGTEGGAEYSVKEYVYSRSGLIRNIKKWAYRGELSV